MKKRYIFLLIFLAWAIVYNVYIALFPQKKEENKASAAPEVELKEKERDPVFNSAYDNSVYQVERYLKQTLRDPDSYQGIQWSSVMRDTTLNVFFVSHKYRAKNGFGGYNVESHVFVMDLLGNVIEVK